MKFYEQLVKDVWNLDVSFHTEGTETEVYQDVVSDAFNQVIEYQAARRAYAQRMGTLQQYAALGVKSLEERNKPYETIALPDFTIEQATAEVMGAYRNAERAVRLLVKVAKFEQDVAGFIDELGKTTRALTETREENKALREQAAQDDQQITELHQDVNAWTERNHAVERRIDELEAAVRGTRDGLRVANENLAATQKAYATLNADYQEALAEIRRLRGKQTPYEEAQARLDDEAQAPTE